MSLKKPGKKTLELAKKWLTGTISEKEKTEFDQWYNNFDDTQHHVDANLDEHELESRMHRSILVKAGIWSDPKTIKKPVRIWPRIAVAASLLLCFSAGLYFITHRNTSVSPSQSQTALILPGSNKATLTLANGKQIVLTGAKNGTLATESGTAINKTADGLVAYQASNSGNPVIEYNTMTTPLGGQYHIILADGSQVWLNAASSIRFPTAFMGNSREVEITGEAYFEVAHNKSMPFRVISKGQTVEVLGTHFNINSYAEEPNIATTLLEGSVKVTTVGGSGSITLKPGEQAINNGKGVKMQNANLESTIDWKDGDFYLDKVNFKTAMRKIARWYNVEVIYDSSVPDDIEAGGWIARSNKLSTVIQSIEATGQVHFKIEDRKIFVFK